MISLTLEVWEHYLLALLVWREARGEGYLGQAGVCHSVLNRVKARSWFGDSISEVIQKPFQYSSMTDPNDPQLTFFPTKSTMSFQLALQIVEDVVNGVAADSSNGATHYLNPTVLSSLPVWAQDPADPTKLNELVITARIGAHVFMRVS